MHMPILFFVSAFILCVTAIPAPIARDLQNAHLLERRVRDESDVPCKLYCTNEFGGTPPDPRDCETIAFRSIGQRAYQIMHYP